MKCDTLKQVLNILYSSSKSTFILKGRTLDRKFEYTFTLNRTIDLNILNLIDGNDSVETFTAVDDIPLTELNITRLEDIRMNMNGGITSRETINLYRETELFLKIMRILKENAVFVIQSQNHTYLAYYIKSRVFYVKTTKERYELVDTNLFLMYSGLPKAQITLVSPLPRYYSYSEFIKEHKNIAKSLNKTFTMNKRGVEV